MAKRKGLSKRTRFEVFKRDSFTCQYCGAKAPDVILNADHIHPHSKGGTDDILNLITSCERCNAGKSDVPLSDQSAIERQRRQIEQLQERRDQLDMMLQWREGLKGIQADALDAVLNHFRELTTFSISASAVGGIKTLVRKYGMLKVLEAMDVSAEQYLKRNQKGEVIHESANDVYKKISGILYCEANPHVRSRSYIKGILRNRFSYWREHDATALLDRAFSLGCTEPELKHVAVSASSWSRWQDEMESLILRKESEGIVPE